LSTNWASSPRRSPPPTALNTSTSSHPESGHDGCRLTQNWANIVVPGTTLVVVPLHPTWLGEQNLALIIVDHIVGVN
jgi:hypothetical protein